MNELTFTNDNGKKITVDKDLFLGRIKVRADGKVQVVTETSDGNETIGWFSWQAIRQAVEEVMRERAEDRKALSKLMEEKE